jgi:hypothetical protein
MVPNHITMPVPPAGCLTFDPEYGISYSANNTITNLLAGSELYVTDIIAHTLDS